MSTCCYSGEVQIENKSTEKTSSTDFLLRSTRSLIIMLNERKIDNSVSVEETSTKIISNKNFCLTFETSL